MRGRRRNEIWGDEGFGFRGIVAAFPGAYQGEVEQGAGILNLFRSGDFTLASGKYARFKIDCDALTGDDWKTLARMAVDILPPFKQAVGVPRGGLPFAEALNKYATSFEGHSVLVADDVLTTGGSIDEVMGRYDHALGVVVFARGACPPGVTELFQMNNRGRMEVGE